MSSPVMHDERIRRILAKNVRSFLALLEISENALAQKCKMSQKQVNNITNARTGCAADALVELADVFGCEPWQLLVEGMDRVPAMHRRLGRLVSSYVLANDADREMVESVARKIGPAS